MAHSVVAGDPSHRLKKRLPQDDAIDERTCHQNCKLTHYRGFRRFAPQPRRLSLHRYLSHHPSYRDSGTIFSRWTFTHRRQLGEAREYAWRSR